MKSIILTPYRRQKLDNEQAGKYAIIFFIIAMLLSGFFN
jgi:hypothetical protein